MRCARARAGAVIAAAWLAAAWLATTSRASAQPNPEAPREIRPTSLAWVRAPGAESCAGPAAVATAVEARLRRPVFVSASRGELSIEVLVEPLRRVGGGWLATITVARSDGVAVDSRTVESSEASCRAAVDAAVATIAQLVEPATAPATSSSSLPATGGPTPVLPSRTGQVAVDVTGALGFGLLPRVAPGISVHARVLPRWAPLQLQVSGKYLFEQATDVRQEPLAQGRFSLLAAGLAICSPPAARRALTTSFCAGGEAGAIAVRDDGLGPASAQTAIVNATVRGNLAFALSDHWRFATAAEVVVPLRRPEFSGLGAAAERVRIYRVAPVAAAFEMGVGWVF